MTGRPTLDSAFVALTGGGTGAADDTDDGGVRA
jgi:hypothetical protein